MKAGFSQIDFTPLEGFMPGEGLPFWARGTARCPLYANAAAFAGEETVILISVDALHFATERASDLRARISEKTGVPFKNILIAATHTHTGASGYEANSGAPKRLSTGMSKKPWICAACRSIASTRSAPALVMRLATSLAEIGSRALALRS